MYMLG